MSRILVVDDEAYVRRVLSVILSESGHEVTEARGLTDARSAIAARQYDLILTDQQMPDCDGLSLLAAAKELDPSVPVIFVTAHATLELAVSAMRQGAFDVLAKPFAPEAVRASVDRACQHAALVRENESLRGAVRRLGSAGQLAGRSASMERLREIIARVAPTSATVLIQGETGTGKELVARAIHEASPRALHPFVPVNCAAFAESLLESELFGHEKGAFTGAERSRQGVFEAAHGGTLFLDEAGEMTPALQAKLLRVLMDGEVVRVGSNTSRRVDVRIIAATHRDLRERIASGLFREDLYYRLAVVPIDVPPLRDHPEDLPDLVAELLERVARDLKIPARRLDPRALLKLSRYSFPGNVRELRNLLERASILSRSPVIGPEEFPIDERAARGLVPPGEAPCDCAEGRPLRDCLERFERALLLRALEDAGGVQAEAARRLGISRSDMTYKLRKFGIGGSRP